MKNLIITLGIFGMLCSCGGEEDTAEKSEDGKSEVEEAVEEKVELTEISSYEFLTKFRQEEESYIDGFKGQRLLITDLVIKSGSYYSMSGMGYDGTNFMGYQRKDQEYIIEGKTMPPPVEEYPTFLILGKPEADESNEIIAPDEVTDESGMKTITYHTIISVEVDADQIKVLDGTNLKAKEAKIVAHRNV